MLRWLARLLCIVFHNGQTETIVAPYTIKTTCENGCIWFHNEH